MNYDFTHQFINIPGYQEITLEIYKKIPNDFYKQHGFIGVNTKFFSNIIGFREMVETFGPWQNVSQIALVNILPDKHIDEFAIHTDVGHKQKLALNLPVYNCNDVYTAFYKPRVDLSSSWGNLEEVKTAHALADIYPLHLMEEFDRYYLTQPVIVNTAVPHTVVNLTSDVRVAISIRWNIDIYDKVVVDN